MVLYKTRYRLHLRGLSPSNRKEKKKNKRHGPRGAQNGIKKHHIARLQSVAAHVRADPVVVEDALDAADRANGHILVPDLAAGEVHHVLLGDLADRLLDVLRCQAAAGRDDLATDVLGHGGGAVQGQQDRGLELGLGALHLGGGDVEAQARPLAQGEVDQVIELGQVLGDEVDTPETGRGLVI